MSHHGREYEDDSEWRIRQLNDDVYRFMCERDEARREGDKLRQALVAKTAECEALRLRLDDVRDQLDELRKDRE